MVVFFKEALPREVPRALTLKLNLIYKEQAVRPVSLSCSNQTISLVAFLKAALSKGVPIGSAIRLNPMYNKQAIKPVSLSRSNQTISLVAFFEAALPRGVPTGLTFMLDLSRNNQTVSLVASCKRGRSSLLSLLASSAISSSPPIMTNKIGKPSTARFSFSLSEGENGEMLLPHSDFTEVPQPMEGGCSFFQRETTGTIFLMYLNVADSADLVPDKWSRWAQFSLAVLNQIHDKYSVRKYTKHQFNMRNSDWGFTLFMPLSELYDPARGYLVNDTCIDEAKVAVRRVINNTMDIIWEPLIVNDEETMTVKMEPEVKEIISVEGITQEPAITNEEPCSRSPPTSMGSPASSLVPVSPLRMNTEELDSIANKYPISEAHKSTWRDIVKKYGDITHKSNIKNLKLKAAYIETICDIISGLKGTTANELKITSINQCESDLEDVESTKIDVSWLKERLHMVKSLLAQSIQVSVVGDSFMVKTETLAKLTASIAEGNSKIEDTRKEITKHEALIMEYQESVKAKNEEFKAVQHAITIQHEEFDRLRNSCTMALRDLP
ncbi:hypothetical protein HHK36_016954 [Tetracentron sinense]|uniref:MATH domain-containing protein n=1 Tax=Tetracentron sinense TaxID=13715 RepID=A0A835DBF2_TETSI|nr:hypothetical protein HHK36_016954 [Tetracentron sinense]